ncbi:hypothetical protein [Brevundimonas sp. FT23042]|uniref:hypothetical protein n=1 Tax=Brevundimonas sp. FT23042 TaxID=3393749 RepID=UPI003B5876E9
MYAQRKAPYAPRTQSGRGGYRQAPIRARVGLAMRRGLNFGALPDAESVLRAHGLSLAPMSVGDAGLNLGGASILPTAQASDIDNGALKALVVPAGAPDADAAAALEDVITRAHAKGAPVFAFGDGVPTALRALGHAPAAFHDAAAVVVAGDQVQTLTDAQALGAAASRVS